MSQPVRPGNAIAAPEFRVERDDTRTVYNGNMAREIAVATYDVSGGDDGTVGAHGLGVHLPDNAVITHAWYDVVTTFTDGADDSATIALSVQSANDLVTATAISGGSNIWDAGQHDATPDGTATNMVKTTAEKEVTATVADDDLTAGTMHIYVEYVISS